LFWLIERARDVGTALGPGGGGGEKKSALSRCGGKSETDKKKKKKKNVLKTFDVPVNYIIVK